MSSPVEGFCERRFDGLRSLLDENVAAGKEVGVTVAVDIDGQQVADLWGGFADGARTRPWSENTVVNVWSSSKMVINLAALVLVDRGQLDVDAPVAAYWPEFAGNGKDGVLVRHVMAHTSGVSGWENPMTVQDLCDVDASTASLAGQAPWWEPGTASGYHANNQGHLIGELVRRVSGSSLTEFVRTELSEPLGADFQIGLRPEDDERAAEIVPPPPHDIDFAALDPASVMLRTFANPVFPAEEVNSVRWRRAEIGAVNGHGNARALCRVLSTIALGGTVDGHRLLRPSTIDLVFEEQARGVDLVLGLPLRWGMGFGLPEPAVLPYIPEGRVCFWGGYGGSLTVIDADRRMTISYAMNKMAAGIIGSERSAEYVTAVYDAVA